MRRSRAINVPEGTPYEDKQVRDRLEELGFVPRGKGNYTRAAVPKRGAMPARPGTEVELRVKPDAQGKERIYSSVSSEALGGGLVYAPENYDAEDVVRRLREWMKSQGVL